jgi:hypothetical protein
LFYYHDKANRTLLFVVFAQLFLLFPCSPQ